MTPTERYFTYIIGCLGTRLLLAILAYNLSGTLRYILATILGLMGLGFMVIYFGGFRKTGLETGGKSIWWNNLRPIHGMLYIIASLLLMIKTPIIYKIKNNHVSSYVLLFDTFIGYCAHRMHRGGLSDIL